MLNTGLVRGRNGVGYGPRFSKVCDTPTSDSIGHCSVMNRAWGHCGTLLGSPSKPGGSCTEMLRTFPSAIPNGGLVDKIGKSMLVVKSGWAAACSVEISVVNLAIPNLAEAVLARPRTRMTTKSSAVAN